MPSRNVYETENSIVTKENKDYSVGTLSCHPAKIIYLNLRTRDLRYISIIATYTCTYIDTLYVIEHNDQTKTAEP